MKSRVFTFISLLALAAAMIAAPSASAQSPAQSVYNPDGEILDVVGGGGCATADGLDADGNPVSEGSQADCADGEQDDCAEADGRDADGNKVSFGSAADCQEIEDVCADADGLDGDGNSVAYGSDADCANSTTPPPVNEGELPFTGFEAGMVGLAGLLLLGAGVGVRRLSRHDA